MTTPNPSPNNVVTEFLSSDFVKTLMAMLVCVGTMTWSVSSAKNEIDKNFMNLNSNIEKQNINMEKQNIIMENRLKNIEDRQERDFDYIRENFVKKTDLNGRMK